ncbi:MAG: diguanylate cyclase [Thermodesulfovibrionales bacterium]|nr:diguanylate cyclase [Thermodesulfovibrionales bacterium]
MFKDEHKIILFSVIGGISVWIIYAFIDSFVFSMKPFWNSLLADDIHELYLRSIFLVSFILFGVIISRLVSKRRQADDAIRINEKRYRMLFENAGDAIFILDAEGEKPGRIVAANQAAAEMHGYTIGELLALNITDLDTPETAKKLPGRIQSVLKGERIKVEATCRKRDGTTFPVEISAGLFELENHKYILAFDRDITERKLAERALRESEKKYHLLMDSVGDSIYSVDRDCRYLFMNRKHLSRLGLTEDSYLGQAYSDSHSPEETKELVKEVNRVFETGESVKHEHLSHRDNRYFLRTLSPVKDEDGNIMAVTVVSKDINEIKHLEEKLRTLSLTDELTGLYNRRGFFTMVEHLLRLAKRQKKAIFVLYADLDNLKEINDTWGHQEGDRALIDTANIFRATFRESDIVARIGGDELVVIPVEATLDTEVITARFQKNLKDYSTKNKRSYTLSISFGISHYNPESPCSIDELLRQAEKLMYDEKMRKQKP